MSEKVIQQVSVIYNSGLINMPGELIGIANKYRCKGFQSKGIPDLKYSEAYSYDFSWPMRFSENAFNFAREVNTLEKTVAIDLQEW
jgi:hypothetical protein